jgi:hypothetical protein
MHIKVAYMWKYMMLKVKIKFILNLSIKKNKTK